MSTLKLPVIVCMACVLFCAGCDPIRKTSQVVHLRVTDPDTGKCVAGAAVLMKYDFVRAEPFNRDDRPDLDDHTHRLLYQSEVEDWNEFPWSKGIADNYGQADVPFEYVRVDHTPRIIFKPPDYRDEVSGKPYLIKVGGDQMEEDFSLIMQVGASVEGELFRITVVGIEEPRYVKMQSRCVDCEGRIPLND